MNIRLAFLTRDDRGWPMWESREARLGAAQYAGLVCASNGEVLGGTVGRVEPRNEGQVILITASWCKDSKEGETFRRVAIDTLVDCAARELGFDQQEEVYVAWREDDPDLGKHLRRRFEVFPHGNSVSHLDGLLMVRYEGA